MANYLEELLFVYPRRYRRYHAWLGGAAATRLIFFELFRLRRKINVVVAGQPLVVRSCASPGCSGRLRRAGHLAR